MEKALREAKLRHHLGRRPTRPTRRAVRRSARALLERPPADFAPFAERRAAGARAALGQQLLKLTAPGVPDIYQGNELWRSRSSIPTTAARSTGTRRRAPLARLRAGGRRATGERKLELIRRALALRARGPRVRGRYEPLDTGPGVGAFAARRRALAVVALRDWRGAAADRPGRWRSVVDDGELLDLSRRHGCRRTHRWMAGGAARARVSSSAAGAVESRGIRRPTKPAVATMIAMHRPASSRWPKIPWSASRAGAPTSRPPRSPQAGRARGLQARARALGAEGPAQERPGGDHPDGGPAVSVPSAEDRVRPA